VRKLQFEYKTQSIFFILCVFISPPFLGWSWQHYSIFHFVCVYIASILKVKLIALLFTSILIYVSLQKNWRKRLNTKYLIKTAIGFWQNTILDLFFIYDLNKISLYDQVSKQYLNLFTYDDISLELELYGCVVSANIDTILLFTAIQSFFEGNCVLFRCYFQQYIYWT